VNEGGGRGWTLEAVARRDAERTRGGGGATTGVTRQPAGKQEANGRGGICEGGGQGWALEAAAARGGAERTRGGGGATTGVTRQPAGKQEASEGGGGVCRQEAVDR
jgi:hypothetical protein